MNKRWLVGLLALGFCFTGAAGLTGRGEKESENVIKAETISPFSNTKVKQEMQTVVEDDGTENVYEAGLTNTYIKGNLCFLEYRLGEIENCFIQPVTDAEYNDEGVEELNFTKTELTSESISEGISKSVSTTKSTSITKAGKETLDWSFSESTVASSSIQVGLEKKDVANFAATFECAVEIGKQISQGNETATSEEIASAVAKETSESYDVSKVQEKLTSMQVTYNMDEYEKGYWYALCMFADVEFYQIVAYDMDTKELYTTYFLSTMSETKGFRLVSSESAGFKISQDYQLKPITAISFEQATEDMYTIEYVVNGGVLPTEESYTNMYNRNSDIILPTPKYSVYEEYNYFLGWYTDEDCTQPFEEDLTKNPRNITLYAKWDLCTVYNNIYETPQITCGGRVIVDWSSCAGGKINYVEAVNSTGTRFGGGNDNLDIAGVDEVVFIGNPDTVYTSVFIYIVNYANDANVSLVFENFNMEGFIMPYNCPEMLTLNVQCIGNNTIAAMSSASSHAIYGFPKCNIRGGGTLTVYGINAQVVTTEASNGINGSAAIYHIGTLTVDMDGGKLVAIGGNGSDATGYWDVPTSSRDGNHGAIGGSGMDAIKVTNMYVVGNSTVVANGGHGARGGDGEASRNKLWGSANTAGNGGAGGKGGAGLCVSYLEVSATATITAVGGNGGNGGNGGTADYNYSNGTPGVGGSGGAGEEGVIGNVSGSVASQRGQNGSQGNVGGSYDSDP